jgi:hypothetical protein
MLRDFCIVKWQNMFHVCIFIRYLVTQVRKEHLAGHCELFNKLLVSIKGGEFLDKLSDH